MVNAIVLCSGGLDSVVTAHKIKENYDKLVILFFDYGQRSLNSEIKFSKQCANDLGAEFREIKILELKTISPSFLTSDVKFNKLTKEDLKDTREEAENWYVPFRNGVFLSYAIALAESFKIRDKKEFDIFVGFKNEGQESYPDTTKKFVADFNSLQGMKIIAPLIEMDKEDIVKLGLKLGVDFRKTHSCYTSNGEHCGDCLSCNLRKEGFRWSGARDPTDYLNI
jgi:7-cyano-7-deazaguanine synthase